MMPPIVLDQATLSALCGAMAEGVAKGNTPLLEALTAARVPVHDLRGIVQANTDKCYSLDTEVKLIKGVLLSLNGTGDGSTGSVPRLEAGMQQLKQEMSGLRHDVTEIMKAVDSLTKESANQKSWTDGWKGVGVAIGVIGVCVTLVGTLITAIIWLFQHGGAAHAAPTLSQF